MAVFLDLLDKKMSYLRARDPSLLPIEWNSLKRKNLNTMYQEHVENCSTINEEDEPESGLLDVYLRIKRTDIIEDIYEIDGNILRCNVPQESQSGRNAKCGGQLTKRYTFSNIFPPDATQVEVFDSVVKRKVLRFINGETSNLLTYGTSGAGKTFTIVGTDEHPGVIPQTLEYVFRSLPDMAGAPVAKPKSGENSISWLREGEQQHEVELLAELLDHSVLKQDREAHVRIYRRMQRRLSREPAALLEDGGSCVSIWISFAEIYNEQVYDLLDTSGDAPRKKLKVYNNNGETYIRSLRQIHITNSVDAYLVLQYGIHNLKYASTSVNAHSSRSHCIFTLTLVQSSDRRSQCFRVSRINFADLAGSERSKVTNNVGSRLNESNNINNSLLVLGRCISLIRTAQKGGKAAATVVPFRESKLTQLFHKALVGQQDISMVVNINPERGMFDETMHALNFSALAKEIVLDKSGGPPAKMAAAEAAGKVREFEERISELQWQVQNLTEELIEERIIREERETEIRHTLIQNFKGLLNDCKLTGQLALQEALAAKDEMIDELAEEVARLKGKSSSPAGGDSVIELDSDEGEVADLSYTTRQSKSLVVKRYEDLYESHQTLKLTHICTEQKLEELQKRDEAKSQQLKDAEYRNKLLTDDLNRQKLEIIKLQDYNDLLDQQVEHSIRYTQAVVEDYENDCHSAHSSDLDI